MIHTTTPNHTNQNQTVQHLTRVQITEAMAKSKGFIVKKNAVVMDGLMPSGILVRRPNEREFTVLHLVSKGGSHVEKTQSGSTGTTERI